MLAALFDLSHVCNDTAHRWLGANLAGGWASCPLTENGLVRALTDPEDGAEPRQTPAGILAALEDFRRVTDHAFWPDDLSLTDEVVFDRDRMREVRRLTGVYLLGLATWRGGRLVTFDTGVPLSAVPAASPANLCVIGTESPL